MPWTLQQMRDEAEALEHEVEALWPDPAHGQAELDDISRQLGGLRTEAQGLDGPERQGVSLIVTSSAMVLLAIVAFAVWLLGAGA